MWSFLWIYSAIADLGKPNMGRSPESPALFGDPREPVTLPVEIGLPPVDTRGEHVFAIFGRKEWILKKSFLIFIKNSWQTVLQRAETSDNHRMSPTRPEINAKSFVFWHVFRSSRWYLPIWVMSLHVEAPFVKNFTFFIFGFFPEPSYDVCDAINHIPGTLNRTHQSARKIMHFFWMNVWKYLGSR